MNEKDTPKKNAAPAKGGCGCHGKPEAAKTDKCVKPEDKSSDKRCKR